MTAILIILVCFLLLVRRAYRNTFRLTINEPVIPLPASGRIPQQPPVPLRVLQLSDLHMENLSITAEQVVAHFHDQPIDLIAITGDFLDRKRNIPKAIQFVQTIQQLQPKLGTFAVLGNHDYLLKPQDLLQLKQGLEEIGCRVLRNESVTVDWHQQKLHIIGIDDYATKRSNLAQSFANVEEQGIRLVLTHDPNVILEMKSYDYDYLLSGHFHGGQIHWPKPYHLATMGKLPKMNMVKGLHHWDGRPFYISEGMGQTGLNVRLRSRPEITLHTIGRPVAESKAVPAMQPTPRLVPSEVLYPQQATETLDA